MRYDACELSRWNGERARCRWCNEVLRGRRRVWCSDACSDTFTRNHSWSWARNAALRRDERTCQRCDRPGGPLVRLEVHHLTPVLGRHGEFSCLHHLDGLLTLCTDCHLEVHAELRAAALGPQPEQLELV